MTDFAQGGYVPPQKTYDILSREWKMPKTRVPICWHEGYQRWYVMPWREVGPQDWILTKEDVAEIVKGPDD